MKKTTSKIKMSASRRVAGWLLLGMGALYSAALQAATLTAVDVHSQDGDRMELRLSFEGEVPEVRGYSIEQPARISLDLLGASSAIKERRQSLGDGNARSVTIVEADERTRLIFNLQSLTGYETRVDGNQLIVALGDRAPASAAPSAAPSGSGITGLDFRRGKEGAGRVILNLSRTAIPADVQERGGKIIARFDGVDVEDRLLRKLDVTDFGTPVNTVETRRRGDAVEITIEPSGAWEYLAYQADNEFSIDVKPVKQEQTARRHRDEVEYSGEKLSLNFQDIEVRSVLQLIADFTSLNLVASDTVSGRITLRLQNVPWDHALDLILRTKGLDKRQVGNVLLVAPADEIAAREQLELESQKKQEALAPLRTEYISISYANATELRGLIATAGGSSESLLSSRGSVVVDQRTNTLIIQDTQAKLVEIRDLITQLDIPVRQVLIEARVVIASNDVSNEFGVRWGGIGYNANSMIKKGSSGAVSGRLQSIRDLHGTNVDRADGTLTFEIPDGDNTNDLIVDLGVQSANASRLAVGFTNIASGLLELELSALEAEGHGELVATPKVLTADQQPAVIASGQQVPFEVATSAGATAIEWQEAELRLEVTPHITPDGNIIMNLKVNNDSFSATGQAAINTNRVETSVLVSDGETVVLGGIFQQEKINAVTKTPFLGDLPWIGNLFRRTVKRDSKQELLIFITPRLMSDVLAGR